MSTLLVLVLTAAMALQPALQLFVLGRVVDQTVGPGSVSALYVVLLAVSLALTTVVNSVQEQFRQKVFGDVSGTFLDSEVAVFADADPDALNDSAVQDELRVRCDSAEGRGEDLLARTLNVLTAALTVVGVGGLIATISPLVAVLI